MSDDSTGKVEGPFLYDPFATPQTLNSTPISTVILWIGLSLSTSRPSLPTLITVGPVGLERRSPPANGNERVLCCLCIRG